MPYHSVRSLALVFHYLPRTSKPKGTTNTCPGARDKTKKIVLLSWDETMRLMPAAAITALRCKGLVRAAQAPSYQLPCIGPSVPHVRRTWPRRTCCRQLSGSGGSDEKEHPMMYSPKAQRFVPLSTKQVSCAEVNGLLEKMCLVESARTRFSLRGCGPNDRSQELFGTELFNHTASM